MILKDMAVDFADLPPFQAPVHELFGGQGLSFQEIRSHHNRQLACRLDRLQRIRGQAYFFAGGKFTPRLMRLLYAAELLGTVGLLKNPLLADKILYIK